MTWSRKLHSSCFRVCTRVASVPKSRVASHSRNVREWLLARLHNWFLSWNQRARHEGSLALSRSESEKFSPVTFARKYFVVTTSVVKRSLHFRGGKSVARSVKLCKRIFARSFSECASREGSMADHTLWSSRRAETMVSLARPRVENGLF